MFVTEYLISPILGKLEVTFSTKCEGPLPWLVSIA